MCSSCGGDDVANVVVGSVGVGLLVISLGMFVWTSSFYGNSSLEDNFDSVDKPTGLLSMFTFAGDLSVAVARTFVDLILFEVPQLPDAMEYPLRILYGLTFGASLLLIIISLVPG